AAGLMRGLGIVSGLVATSAMVIMLWLSARVPLIERTIGQDRALALHKSLGQWTFGGLVLHGLYLVTGYAMADQLSWTAEFATLWGSGDFVLAVVAIVLLALVAVTSIAAAKRRLGHEVWQGIHLTTYAAILLALPHQFSMGGLFADGVGHWFWLAVWGATFFVMLAWRVLLPLFASVEHRLCVTGVVWETPDTVSIELTGRRLADLDLRAGHFLHFRFLQAGLWWHQHPFSLSAAPHGDTIRITVRMLGDGTRQLAATLRPGTRVLFEGPYGVFTDAARTAPDVVLVGFGIGAAPIRALLEGTDFVPGHATVIIRASSELHVAHRAELEAWCRARGVRLHIIAGHRHVAADGTTSWLTSGHQHLCLADLAGPLADADVYVCGPEGATDLLWADARAAGVPEERLHREEFAW
ncbi:MAG: ferric reductase-like transmembrane domain-containing protein, partial [Propionibacteriaceae bacterium]|nr:ferric reductase-like transmembrane domain-containing protein [Propionibacteriaceae bacterium]